MNDDHKERRYLETLEKIGKKCSGYNLFPAHKSVCIENLEIDDLSDTFFYYFISCRNNYSPFLCTYKNFMIDLQCLNWANGQAIA